MSTGPDVYRVKLTVSPSGASLTKDLGVRSITNGQNTLTPGFSWNPPAPAPGQSVSFSDTTTPADSVGQWTWDFDDGSKSYLRNPSKTFPAGNHPVTLTVQNQADFKQLTLIVAVAITAPVADFTFSPLSPSLSDPVAFTDTSTNSPTAWAWNFDDPGSGAANTSTLQNPTHTFSVDGSHNVQLTATNAGGSSTRAHMVNVGTLIPPVANFSYVANKLSVAFTDTSTGPPDTWGWNFGDPGSGSHNMSFVRNPTHVFSQEGTFTVTLVVSNAAGSSSKNRTLTVHSTDSVPVADFTFAAAGLDVAFTDTSTGPPTSWSWNFGDAASGATNASALQNPTHVFSAPGAYSVTLTATNSKGSAQVTKTVAASNCAAGAETLCLSDGRFRVQVAWSVPAQQRSGIGQAVPLTTDTGYFWFFTSTNVELVVKVLDASGVNQHFWVFYGALSNVQYTITVTDTVTGAVKTYENPSGTIASHGDTSAFPSDSAVATPAEAPSAAGIETRSTEELYGMYAVLSQATASPAGAGAGCTQGSTTLCLSQARFQVSVDWEVPSQNRSGFGTAVPVTADTGYFWFFSEANVELMIKVLDARTVNQHFWVFYGALSNVKYTITVRDTQTGAVKTYVNESGNQSSRADTSAF